MKQRPAIWAFGSGKGGVGRSQVAANVAVALAKRGHRCALIDADLGAGNLHTLLGVKETPYTLSDFLARGAVGLAEVLAPTSTAGLSLASGARAAFGSPHLKPEKTRELLDQLPSLAVEHVVVDLPAVPSFHALDLFLAAERSVMVVMPEPTSVENAYHFLKAAFFRRLQASAREAGAEPVVEQAMREKAARGIQSPRELLAFVGELDPRAGRALHQQIEGFRPRLIVNQVRQPAEAGLGKEMILALRDFLGIEARYLGSLPFDDAVRRALHERRAALELFPTSPFSSQIGTISSRLFEDDVPAAAGSFSDDFRILGLEPGCRLTDVMAAHKRLKELYSQPSLATYSEADEGHRTAMLERVEEASRRILREVSGAIPLAGL